MVVSHNKGLSKSIKRSCRKCGVQVHFKGGLTIKNLLMAPKDKEEVQSDTKVIGWIVVKNTLESQQEHLLRGSRNIRRLLPQYMTTTTHDYNTSGHSVTIDNFSIVGREDQNILRTIKEALYIRVNNPSLNRNIGKYHLPHIWDEVLFNIAELKIK